jgi:peptidoglycan/LPS O-acetylase OafA/YrhL
LISFEKLRAQNEVMEKQRLSEMAAISRRHVPALDGVRGLAILAVFLLHYGGGGVSSHSWFTRRLGEACAFGWSGVDLFFVLSGFLITGILYDTRQDAHYYRNFYIRRALRIFPVYYLFALIALLIVPFTAWHKGDLLFLAYLGYPAAIIWPALVHVPIRITHLWSLAVEEQFYAIWPSLIRKLPTLRHMLWTCAAAICAAPILRVAFPAWAYASLPSRMDDLAWGAAVALLLRAPLGNRYWRFALPVFMASGSAVILLCASSGTSSHDTPSMYTAGFSLIAIACASLLVLALGPLSGVFSIGPLRTLGKYSYGMYLYHFPLTSLTEHAKPFFMRYPAGEFGYVGACLTANLLIAALSFHVFEQPILRLKEKLTCRDLSPGKSSSRSELKEVQVGS